ncbi:MAG: DUF4386 domain-containing protein [Cytophagales bacterium]|nr:DUF4386 domain-containing protein [Cytophagales bacterium]
MLYLVVVLTGIFSLQYVPSKLIVWDDATQSFNNIVRSITLFRFGIVSGLVCYTFFLLLPWTLYILLKQVNKFQAMLMAILASVSVPIAFTTIQHKYSVLSLISEESYLSVFSTDQLQAMVMFELNQYDNGMLISKIFWGLWLLPFGYLVFKSGFLPKILGVLLMIGCFGYLINFLGYTLISDYSKLGIASIVQLPASLGEVGICLWLLIFGAKNNSSSTLSK